MGKLITAEYDAATNTLRLVEPVEGLQDRQRVRVTIFKPPTPDGSEPSWKRFDGILSKEAGDDLARAIDEMFPPWNADE